MDARVDQVGSEKPDRRVVRVAVIINNVGGYSRGVLRGVASYANARAWVCRVQGVNVVDLVAEIERVDGLIIQAATPEQAGLLERLPVPAVNVSSALGLKRVPSVVSDDPAVGRVGADHLIRLGHIRFAFFCADDRQYAQLRYEGFKKRLAEEKREAAMLIGERELPGLLGGGAYPLAVMAANDRSALLVLDACRERGLRVPEDVAVLGVDDDELMQSLAHPPLSSVNTARDRIGFEAAAMLESLMSKKRVASDLVQVAPQGVIARKSTLTSAVDDPDVAETMRYIHANAGRPISINDIARVAAVSRRQLERRFRATLGRSIHDELHRCRMDRAQRLLLDTGLTLPQVSLACGFTSPAYFSTVFKRDAGQTPQQFREANRMPRAG